MPELANQQTDLICFYGLLSRLAEQTSGPFLLSEPYWSQAVPPRGVYFFFEDSEVRSVSGAGSRVVRVGTHALKVGSQSTLAQRLKQHRGSLSGGGNHRGSIFRLLVGQALMARGEIDVCPTWGLKPDAGQAARVLGCNRKTILDQEIAAELAVSRYIGAMPFLWLDVSDEPGPDSLRGYIERNSIALLSHCQSAALDAASPDWLGRHSNRHKVSVSGLWNQRHVEEDYQPAVLECLARLIDHAA